MKIRRTFAALLTAGALLTVGTIASPGLDDVKAQASTEAGPCVRIWWFTDKCTRLW